MSSAQAAVTFYTQRSPLLRGHVIHAQFSSHDQLLADDAPFQVPTAHSCCYAAVLIRRITCLAGPSVRPFVCPVSVFHSTRKGQVNTEIGVG